MRRDVLFGDGFGDQMPGQNGGFLPGEHPPEHIAAEDVEEDVQVEVRPLGRPLQPRDVPGPDLVAASGQEFRLGVSRMARLVAPLANLAPGRQEANTLAGA